MPRISPLAKASTLACADAVTEPTALTNGLSLSRMKNYAGFGEGVCTCARCMRRAGPIREDVENKLVQITYALANVYDDSPDLEVRVTDAHRQRAEEMMACVESGDVTHLREAFLEIEEQESDGLLEGGTATEVATYLIISAAQVGQPEVIRLLAEWDADMEETDSIRRGRPLMHAANNGHTAAVKALVECGADPEATDDNGYTALMVAVFSDRSSAAEALVEGGACVDAQDRAGRTALSYAAMYGSTDCIYLLAARGADVAHVDHDGNTPLELAEGSGRQSAVDALKKLQLRVKMQEKRKVKQSKCRSGCLDLNAEQLQAKEQEAARAAAELLELLEKEETAKSAKATKKKKKGKFKPSAHDSHSAYYQRETAPGMLEAAADALHHHHHQQQQQQHTEGLHRPLQPTQQQQPANSDGGAATVAWLCQDRDIEHEDGLSCQAANSKHPRKQPKQAGATSPGSGIKALTNGSVQSHHVPLSDGDEHSTGEGSAVSPTSVSAAAAAVSGSPVADELDVLRHEWEALLDQAARCRDQEQQPPLLKRVAEMLPRCSDAGISVKYGRKVLQRLLAVGPARAALQAALSTHPPICEELVAALHACKVCRSLLEERLLQHAEAVLADLLKEQERLLKEQERAWEEQHARQRALQEAAAAKAEPADVAAQQAPQAQQWTPNSSKQKGHAAPAHSVPQQQQQQPHHVAWPAQAVQQPQQQHHQLQYAMPTAQQQAAHQAAQKPRQQAVQRPVQQPVQQPQPPAAQPLTQLPVQSTPVQQPARQQPLIEQPQQPAAQHSAVQQNMVQHHAMQSNGVQHPAQQVSQQPHPLGFQQPPVCMPLVQQPMRGIRPKQHQSQLQQQPRGQPLLPSQLQLLHQNGLHDHAVTAGLAVPLGTKQQQQQPMSQLQLLQQQQLFASQHQSASQLQQQQHGLSCMVQSSLDSQSLLGSSLLARQPLPPVTQAPPRLHQQQQLNGNYWAHSSHLAAAVSGGFGSMGQPIGQSIGQPVARSLSGCLSLEMLSPPPVVPPPPPPAGLSAATGELVRRNSLTTPVAVVAPVLLSGQGDADVLDDHQHPAYAMANAVLSDDERDSKTAITECTVCFQARANACCLPCGCLKMCQGCTAQWSQQDRTGASPFCKHPLEDFAVVS